MLQYNLMKFYMENLQTIVVEGNMQG